MRSNFLLVAIFCSFLLVFSSCKNYEEGPSFTLASVNSRLIRTWYLSETIPASENTEFADLGKLKLVVEKDAKGAFGMGMFALDIMWKLDSKKENISLKLADDVNLPIGGDEVGFLTKTWIEFKILKLTKKEFWIENSTIENGTTKNLIIKFKSEL